MKLRALLLFLLSFGIASAAAIDGAWTTEMKTRGGKKAGSQQQTVSVTMNLKSENGQITGSVITGGRKRSQTAQISGGKLDGNSFTFETVHSGKRGEQKTQWRGTLDGDTLQGTCMRVGKRREQTFTAKRS